MARKVFVPTDKKRDRHTVNKYKWAEKSAEQGERINACVEPQCCSFNPRALKVTSTSARPQERQSTTSCNISVKGLWDGFWWCEAAEEVILFPATWWPWLPLWIPQHSHRGTNEGISNWHSLHKNVQNAVNKVLKWKHLLNVSPAELGVLYKSKSPRQSTAIHTSWASLMQTQPKSTGFNHMVIKSFCHSVSLSQSRPKSWFSKFTHHLMLPGLWHHLQTHCVSGEPAALAWFHSNFLKCSLIMSFLSLVSGQNILY